MEQTNHHDSEQDPFWENDWSPNLTHASVPSVPGTLLPAVLARLGLNHAPFSGEPSIEELVTALNDPAWQVRTAAIQALGSLDEHVPIEPLLAALDDEDPSVRAAAIWANVSLPSRSSLLCAIRTNLYPGRLHWRSHRLIPRLYPYWLRRLPYNNPLHPLHLLHPDVPIYFTSPELDWQHCSW